MPKNYLDQCEKEPLQYSGAIQPHGVLVVCDQHRRVSHLSQNCHLLSGSGFDVELSATLPPAYARIELPLQAAEGARSLRLVETPVGVFFVTVTCNAQGDRLFEFVKNGMTKATLRWPLGVEHDAPPTDDDELEVKRQALVDTVRAATGFKRVMYYAFLEDDDGEVVAESRDADVYGSYLGLRFPASDIPQIARLLYIKNPWRFIPDALAAPVPLAGVSSTPPDLSYSDLRSVSPVHVSYLANMGVKASLSIPVLAGGKLIALIAAHDNQPHPLSADVLERVSRNVHAHALALNSFRAQKFRYLNEGIVQTFESMKPLLMHPDVWDEHWNEIGAWLLTQFDAAGAVLLFGQRCWAIGQHPDSAGMLILDEWLCRECKDPVWMSESLSRTLTHLPLCPVSGAIGVRGMPVQGGRVPRLFLFREEHVHEVKWGGNPEKPIESSDGKFDIKPRRSFEMWVEKRLGYSRPWETEMRYKAFKLRELLASGSRR